MIKSLLFSFCFLFLPLVAFLQEENGDTSKSLSEVVIKAFEQNRSTHYATSSIAILESNNGDRYNKTSLVNGFNSVAGVRMEERSPGSYRINIRGSSLRSPFGVRNVKVYWNDIPITDPGGNTYFNQFAFNNFSYLEIFKGPAGSLYGAGTGGLILMHNLERWQPGVSVEYLTGSYNLQNVFFSGRFGKKDNRNQLTYAHNQSDGYRVQSRLRRDNFSWMSRIKSSDKEQLTASALFTDMYYQTPGALTLTEFNKNPKDARPGAGSLPSAVTAKAAIYQKNFLAGLNNEYAITNSLKNSTSLYGALAQIKNPAIRNYERRIEPQLGGRTTFILHQKLNESEVQIVGGSEYQKGYFNTQVSQNKGGNPDTLQTNDDINYTTYNVFGQADLNFMNHWLFTAGASLNRSNVIFSRLNKYPVIKQSRTYQNEIAPRFSLLKKFDHDISLLATVSKGFSPPTIAELLPSTGIISTYLEAEHGWDYEITGKYYALGRRLYFEATGFYFILKDALVQRHDPSGADFFINAGKIKEKGAEISADYTILSPTPGRVLNYLNLKGAYTYNHFRYDGYKKDTIDFSGNQIPSVPAHSISLLADAKIKNGLYTNITYYYASKIFLDDANTAAAKGYHLLGVRIGWSKSTQKRSINVFTGVDNLLDEIYSLGNDINAFGGRYYNAAPRRNYYMGISFQISKLSEK